MIANIKIWSYNYKFKQTVSFFLSLSFDSSYFIWIFFSLVIISMSLRLTVWMHELESLSV